MKTERFTITRVAYSMLRVTAQYENDRVEVTLDMGPKPGLDDFDAAVLAAKAACQRALKLQDPQLIERAMSTPQGAQAVKKAAEKAIRDYGPVE